MGFECDVVADVAMSRCLSVVGNEGREEQLMIARNCRFGLVAADIVTDKCSMKLEVDVSPNAIA